MPLPLVAAGISLLPALYKTISGIGQTRKASQINPTNPGYQMNQAVIDNARRLSERASNYQLPNYGQALNNINTGASSAFSGGVQGASSGGDVLDLATKIAYGQGQRLNELAVANAEGSDQALLQSLNANALAGEEYQNKNAYDRDLYQQQLREKAALTQAGNENIYGGLDTAGTVGQGLLNPMSFDETNPTAGLTPQQIAAYNRNRARLKMSGI